MAGVKIAKAERIVQDGGDPVEPRFMTLDETLKQLRTLGNEKMRAHNTKKGAGDNQFGVKHGDIRMLAKKIHANHKLAMSLWETGNVGAQLLATLLFKPKNLPAEAMDRPFRRVAPHPSPRTGLNRW